MLLDLLEKEKRRKKKEKQSVRSFLDSSCNTPAVGRIVKNKSVEEYEVDPYLATVLNCTFWLIYGLPFVHPDRILVLTINPIGLAIELIYIGIFFFYAPNQGRKKVVYCLCGGVIFVVMVLLVFLQAFHDHKRRIFAFGSICNVFNIIMYSSPLTIMVCTHPSPSLVVNYKPSLLDCFASFFTFVEKSDHHEYMPFYLSLANFLNGCVWTAYALVKLDIFILISNGLGASSGVMQLILYRCYFRSTMRDEKLVYLKSSQFHFFVSDGLDGV
ncbi:hypothetical protein BT93_C0467 [Corymbia citriodora subsp. variegata]|nr:hypothetical protein BT93_C0467 [Corymbia citriodora subsp. variegata]